MSKGDEVKKLGFADILRNDMKRLTSLDLMLAVVIGVIARIYMIVGSPAINVLLHGMGPLGDLINAASFLVVLYALLMLPGMIRLNGITAWLTAMLMAIFRILTGDPWGVVALQAYFLAGFFTWLTLAALRYKLKLFHWFIAAFVWTFWVDLIFGLYFAIWPLFGSVILGWIFYLIVQRIICGFLVAIVLFYAYRALTKVEAMRGIIITKYL